MSVVGQHPETVQHGYHMPGTRRLEDFRGAASSNPGHAPELLAPSGPFLRAKVTRGKLSAPTWNVRCDPTSLLRQHGVKSSRHTSVTRLDRSPPGHGPFRSTGAIKGGRDLASSRTQHREIGHHLKARYVRQILAGTPPKDLPVEYYDKIELALNLRTAREIGLAIPLAIRDLADKVVQ
jgi:hypothetical protein